MRQKLLALPWLLLLLPLDVAVGITLLLVALIGMVRRGLKPATTFPVSNVRSTIVILNWDGKHLLAECLPSVVEAVKADGGRHEILVVDNGSTDGSVDFIHKNFPTVRVLELDQNYGFTGGNNRGVDAVETDIVVLLNNDMIADRAFLRPLLNPFKDPSVFAVTSQIFFADPSKRREETGKTRAEFERGFFYLWHDDINLDDERRELIPVVWAGGGSCAIDRNKYLAIGGLDPLYEPFYVEDADLSYQAWKRGWKCLLAPASRVIHKHRGTSGAKFGETLIESTIRRNLYLFVWKNVTDLPMVLQHVINLPRIHGRAMLRTSSWAEIRAYFRAIQRLPHALQRRLANLRAYSISDEEALSHSQKS